MNKFIKNLFLVLFPYYPLWAWVCDAFIKKPIDFLVSILLLPFALYYIVFVNKKLPKYLVFFIVFTIYHVCSIFINNTYPKDLSKIFLLADPNILACLIFIIIEYSVFDEKFIDRMTKNILLIVVISLLVSLVQIKFPTFFFNGNNSENLFYIGEEENRAFSIFSWTSLNSCGISFPILISLLVNKNNTNKFFLPFVIFSGIIVCFLTRARYVMISAIVVLSQLLFNKKRSISKRASFIFIFIAGILILGFAANQLGYNINEVINNRILEKGSDMESAKARILSYDVFVSVFPKHPWFGVGPATKEDVVDLLGGEAPLIHVGYLSYLYFYGVAGCLLFFLAIFFLLKEAWIVGKKYNFWGSFYGLLSFLLANTTFVYFQFSEMGIVLALIYLRYNVTKDISQQNIMPSPQLGYLNLKTRYN